MSYADRQLIPVTVKKDVEVTNKPHDAQEFYVDFAADAFQTLSEYYGKNVRQGNSFKLKRIDVGLQPETNDGLQYDTGMAVQLQGVYTPVTKHSRRGWNQLFQEWKKQKQLKGVVGSNVRYDDFELAWNDIHGSTSFLNRVSYIHAQGIADPDTQEMLCIQGTSAAGLSLTLKDYYEDRNPIPEPSSTPFGGVVKEPKFSSYWPENCELQASCTLSADLANPSIGPTDALTGAIAMQTAWEGNVNVFCGSMHWYAYIIPDDTLAQWADKAELTVTFWIESWKPLVYSSRKSSGRSTRGTYRRHSSGRRSGKRRYTKRSR